MYIIVEKVCRSVYFEERLVNVWVKWRNSELQSRIEVWEMGITSDIDLSQCLNPKWESESVG
jgi:hypothetical protein